ncbi:hypothetical protein [Nocardioides panacisoli]|uniref:DUF4375 domain-containing protein n=1 Tax=Nocardioides panacisoli TaxID=627624 RepID=A0ABP7I799_9ACTN
MRRDPDPAPRPSSGLTPADSAELTAAWRAEIAEYWTERRRLLRERIEQIPGWAVLELAVDVLDDGILETAPIYWEKRAEVFDALKPALTAAEAEDCPGLVEDWLLGDERAQACRNRAALERMDFDLHTEVTRVHDEFWQAIDPAGDYRNQLDRHRHEAPEAA